MLLGSWITYPAAGCGCYCMLGTSCHACDGLSLQISTACKEQVIAKVNSMVTCVCLQVFLILNPPATHH
jgi:hypothetical protein